MAARAGHSEQAYEALLAAGRARWTPGERVRFYRSQSGISVWVPDEGEEIIIGNVHEDGAKEDERKPNEALLSINSFEVKTGRLRHIYTKLYLTSVQLINSSDSI